MPGIKMAKTVKRSQSTVFDTNKKNPLTTLSEKLRGVDEGIRSLIRLFS